MEAMTFGSQTDLADARQMVIDAGITFFDTAAALMGARIVLPWFGDASPISG